jgi:hypothetical protein
VVRRNPGVSSIVGGVVFAVLLFVVGGGGRLEFVNVALAAVGGVVFAAAMYQSARRGRSS